MTASVLQDVRRPVIKIDFALLIDDQGRIDRNWLNSLAADVDALDVRGNGQDSD